MATLTISYRPWIVVLAIVLAAAQLSGQKAKLSSAQLEHLIQIHAPDDLIANQVRTRGVGFAVTAKAVEAFSRKGAGPNTIAALRALDVTSVLEIHSEPDVSVSIDGKSAGMLGPDGMLRIGDLQPGPHTLLLAKAGFHENHQSVTLGPHDLRQISVPLEWAGGVLSVSLVPATAELSITGPASFSGAVQNVRCPAGSYTASVHRDGFLSQTRTFTVAAGENHREAFRLAIDPAVLNKTLEEAQKSLTGGELDAAIRASRLALEMDEHNGQANAIFAEASFLNGDLREFPAHAMAAVQAGNSVTISLMHLHTFPRHTIHRVEMTVSGAGVKFALNGPAKCKMPQALSYQQIAQMSVLQSEGVTTLHINWVDHPGSMMVHDIDFVPLGSDFVSPPAPPGTIMLFGPKVLQTPSDTRAQYRLIIDLVAQARR